MSIRDILKIEEDNLGTINLFKEGIFWRVYQRSAYYFTKHIKELKILKKKYKIVDREVVYGGFPDTILFQIETLSKSKALRFEKHNEKHCCISGLLEGVDKGYDEWVLSVPFHTTNGKSIDKIMERIKNYPVVSKTPLETQRFLVEIQYELNYRFAGPS